MPTSPIPLITLTTDFGLGDHYVGVMKGVMLKLNPKLQLVDICHQLPSYSVSEAAYTLDAAYSYFPAGTIHLIVVDPGVGSRRRPILAQGGDYYFIAPDNGVLSLVWQREKNPTVIEINSAEYLLPTISSTFQGRDVFAPAAGWLSQGVDPRCFGPLIRDYLALDLPGSKLLKPGVLSGQIIRVDKFGNLITNITAEEFSQFRKQWGHKGFKLQLGRAGIKRLIGYYAQGQTNEACAIIGSSGRLEVVIKQQPADKVLGVGVGQEFSLMAIQ